jgi:hypothetical protein
VLVVEPVLGAGTGAAGGGVVLAEVAVPVEVDLLISRFNVIAR